MSKAEARLREAVENGYPHHTLTLEDGRALLAGLDRLTRERDEARAECDAMAKDAARYRWLRDKANFARKHDPMVCLHPLDEQELICGPELDAVMDIVLAQIEQEERP